jgi:hypothetical protein
MSEAPSQPQPQTIIQAGGRVAENLVSGFQGSPQLLLIVTLNVAMILTGGYYMLQQDKQRNEVVKEVITIVRACILETSPLERYRLEQEGPPQ